MLDDGSGAAGHVELEPLHRSSQGRRDLPTSFSTRPRRAGIGHRFLVSAHDTFALLATQPEMGWSPKLRHPDLRGVRVFRVTGFDKILILYRPVETGIEVLRWSTAPGTSAADSARRYRIARTSDRSFPLPTLPGRSLPFHGLLPTRPIKQAANRFPMKAFCALSCLRRRL